jgi:hypothetical protein
MSTERLERTKRMLRKDCEKVLLRLAQLTKENLAEATSLEWAPTVEKLMAIVSQHNRDHAQQIMAKRELLSLEQTQVQKLLAEIAASQGTLDAALVGLSDEDLESVPEGETWSLGQTLEHVSGSYSWFLSEIEKAIAS